MMDNGPVFVVGFKGTRAFGLKGQEQAIPDDMAAQLLRHVQARVLLTTART